MENELELYLDAVCNAFNTRYTGNADKEWIEESNNNFKERLTYTIGKTYAKVISNRAAHSFVVLEDGPKFKKGDILKAASWASPAKNFACANVYNVASYFESISWTGA
jgi:hypothetical protein